MNNKKLENMKKNTFSAVISKESFMDFKSNLKDGDMIMLNNIVWENNESLPTDIIAFFNPKSKYYQFDNVEDAINLYLLDNYNDIALEYEYTI